MLMLIAAAAGVGFFSGEVRTIPWMVALTLAIVIMTAVMALASGASWLAVFGYSLGAGGAFQVAYVMAAIRQEAVRSRIASRDVAPVVQS